MKIDNNAPDLNTTIERIALSMLKDSTDDYAKHIWDAIKDDVCKDVRETTQIGDLVDGVTTGDIKLSLGRVIARRVWPNE